MDDQEIKALLAKYNQGTADDEEKALIETWYLSQPEKPLPYPVEELGRDLDEVEASLNRYIKGRTARLWPRIAAAASILLVLSFGAYFLTHKKEVHQVAQVQPADIIPGTHGATLTLANGQKIALNHQAAGQIARQGNATIRKAADGELVYTAANTNAQLLVNMVATQRKETYQLTLADGTKVWLNAASSIRYPVTFNGDQREVEITGEAYFEVAHNAAKPFRVSANGQTIQVLGTHFNVNAYNDEPQMVTTLLEGSVKIEHNGQAALLRPGQQASVGQNINISTANVQQAVAWKDGRFLFAHTQLKTLLRQVARWYDLDLVYQGPVANDEFNGQISRGVSLDKMLRILQSGDVHFRLVTENHKNKLVITN